MKCFLLLLSATVLVGCALESKPNNLPAETKTVSIPESDAVAVESDSTPNSPEFVIDVRSKDEWDRGHVERAVHIPHTEIADRIAEVTDDKNAKIVLYCAVGGRAGKAKSKLEELGFTNVENAGGFDDVKERYK